MPVKGYRSITVKESEYNRIQKYLDSHNMSLTELLEQRWKEREELQDLARKIKKIPETYRTYIFTPEKY